MKPAYRIALGACVAAAVGCGTKNPTQPQAEQRQTSEVERFAQQTKESIERQTGRVRNEWDRASGEADRVVRDTRGKVDGLVNEADRKRNEMEEFATQMAEDAKDRVLDIPDAIDEFFGAPSSSKSGEGRRSWRGGNK